MEKYFSAILKMEQTVMFPSLLRGVSFEEQEDGFGGQSDGDKDLYEYYVQLKSIRFLVEGSLAPLGDRLASFTPPRRDPGAKDNADLQSLFSYHVAALRQVLQRLTQAANDVTSKYNGILRQINQSEIPLRW
ncbi:mid1-interacting protein 1-B-like [Python bivittatus]|uniref:Mid1-interacting protein 1-B-like n=1 Tax=Python bivittatus TaxID=176946 RepID=A0A9F5N5R2_PYTBI|nr:mid1-interacting protein 1-B-like [Python bivittatus]